MCFSCRLLPLFSFDRGDEESGGQDDQLVTFRVVGEDGNTHVKGEPMGEASGRVTSETAPKSMEQCSHLWLVGEQLQVFAEVEGLLPAASHDGAGPVEDAKGGVHESEDLAADDGAFAGSDVQRHRPRRRAVDRVGKKAAGGTVVPPVECVDSEVGLVSRALRRLPSGGRR